MGSYCGMAISIIVVYQAVCLEELTAQELLMKLLDKLVWLDASQVVSFVRLTSSGLLVRIDDTVVHGMQHEDSFLLQTIKGGWALFGMIKVGGLYLGAGAGLFSVLHVFYLK